MAEVRLNRVNKIYDNKNHVVKDLDLHIRDKEFMVLVGPSGCGKSTTLRMIAGLEEITSGEVYIGDKLVNQVEPAKRDIAMVFQNYALYPHMTVYENLAFALKLRGMDKAEINSRVQEAAQILGLTEYLERKPKQLSGGQRQRVAVGRAIVRHPQVFLFDEPLSNLDAKLRVQMRAEINHLHKRLGITMIYVTHDQTEAMTMGDRIAVLKDGKLLQVDTPLHLYDNPADLFTAGFIGSPSMNFIRGKLDNDYSFKAAGFTFEVPSAYRTALANHREKEVIMGIRPEHITTVEKSPVRAVVEVVEPMGSEVFIHTRCALDSLLLRRQSRDLPKNGDQLCLALNENTLHFFDPVSELSLTYRAV